VSFAQRVVAWQKVHGRNDLPWQNTQDPYRVWLSEIMLQQTQVVTVKAYFARFLEQFADVQSLAGASLDEVLGLWSGLGYYSRARNLHLCAKAVVQTHGGEFPRDAGTLETLPGIGRSTAAAISSLCFGERVAILDANVKRVVTRAQGFDSDLAISSHEKLLWEIATKLLPQTATTPREMARYTQGMMDLGATVCVPKSPRCGECPVASQCVARRNGDPERYPVRSRKIKRSSQRIFLLLARASDGAVWLARRPAPGVWAGLHCPPLFDTEEAMCSALTGAQREHLMPLDAFKHVLTHKDLHLHPFKLEATRDADFGNQGRWVGAAQWPGLGLPAPIRKLLDAHAL
jgi:A/G-specific adenine glycosylase